MGKSRDSGSRATTSAAERCVAAAARAVPMRWWVDASREGAVNASREGAVEAAEEEAVEMASDAVDSAGDAAAPAPEAEAASDEVDVGCDMMVSVKDFLLVGGKREDGSWVSTSSVEREKKAEEKRGGVPCGEEDEKREERVSQNEEAIVDCGPGIFPLCVCLLFFFSFLPCWTLLEPCWPGGLGWVDNKVNW